MPFTSSPELEDGQSGADSGVLLQSGGITQDAGRQAQLEAIHAAQAEAVAARQQAIAAGAQEYAARQATEQQAQAELLEHRTQQQDQTQSYACSLVIIFVIGVLGYMAWDAHQNRFTGSRREQ